ncbi:MAG: sugar transferase [Nitrospirae bacterium]|nr:sugar transferase [Nitrospirota bacterium]
MDLFKFSDIVIVVLSLVVSYPNLTRRIASFSIKELLHARVEIINVILVLVLMTGWHLIFNGFLLYRSRRIHGRVQEICDIIKATTAGALIIALFGIFFSIDVITTRFIVVFWLTSTLSTISFRGFLRYFLSKTRAFGRNLRFILIVGTNQRAYDFADMIEERKESGYRLIGFIDKEIYKPNRLINILGTLEDFPSLAKNNVIDEVVISLPIKSYYDEISKIVFKAEEHGIVIRYLSQMFNTKVAQSRSDVFEEYAVMTMSSGPQSGWQLITKRVLDMAFSTTCIILLSPLMLFITLLIKLTSPGPVLFVQDRVGYNKRLFRLYKFRTMVINAEQLQSELESHNEMEGPVFKIRNDPRVTKVGRLLRKFSLDELPQLFNVVKGEMSLVGPRPLPIRDFNNFHEDWLHRRCSVIPGMTCTWQISGRNNINFEEWIKLDMQYIDNWNLVNDFMILIRTIPAVFKGVGAA